MNTNLEDEHGEYRVSLSVGTKLTVSLLILLGIAISYLDISSILLFRNDKKAYTFQSQSIEAEVAGKEFVNIAKQAINVEKLLLAAIDPEKSITSQQEANLLSIFSNQGVIAAAKIGLLDKEKKSISTSFQKNKTALADDDLKVPDELFSEALPQLLKDGYTFFNITKLGSDPLIVISFADLSYKSPSGLVPIALAYVVFKEFAKEVKTSILTIATRTGNILFSTDPTVIFSESKITEDPFFQNAVHSTLASGVQENKYLGTKYLGSFFRPGFDLVILTKTPWYKAMAATYALIEEFVLLGLMTIGAAIVFGVLFSKTMTKPISQLYLATKEVAAGNFTLKLKEIAHDEIGALTRSFMLMSKKITDLIVESLQRLQLENEISIASTVQHALIPSENYLDDKIQVSSLYKPANQCGGDWWGFFRQSNQACIMIADATGHGLPSALITASARSCLSIFQKQSDEAGRIPFTAQAMLNYLNFAVFDAAHGHIMMTFFVCIFDLEKKILTYANAGHNPPWLLKKEGDTYFPHSLNSGGIRLGESLDMEMPPEVNLTLGPGDILFLYTDGLIEGKNPAGEFYGKKSVRKTVLEAAPQGSEAVVKAVLEDYKQFSQGHPLEDDITLVATRLI